MTKTYDDKTKAGHINEFIDQMPIIDAAKEQMAAIKEVAVEKYGEEAKQLPSWAKAVYDKVYKPEKYEENKEKKLAEFEVVEAVTKEG
jgi:hypothetical protein